MNEKLKMQNAKLIKRLALAGLLFNFSFLILHCSFAAEPTAAQLEFFENEVRPVLSKHCYKCHSVNAEKVKGGLLLDSREATRRGGDTGPAVVPGHPEQSLLIQAVRYTDPDLQMPPKQQLSEAEIAALERWVQMGAPDPRGATAAQKEWKDAGLDWWAWQPLTKPAVPVVNDKSWAQTPLDHFILAKLDDKGLKPNPIADKRTLIRRATFDLIGLPPTPEEVEAFIADPAPDAFAKVVDRLLATPHYGERWGRHWLDVARYSDTKGMVRRQREDPRSPYAWTYRDYVIRSFNEDKPYPQFVIEQLAADKLPATRNNPTNLTALGFLTVGERFMGMRHDVINDQIDVVTKGFLGLTVSCARCHDHKFDPIPTKDYYSLHGIFASTTEPAVETPIQRPPKTSEYADYYQQRTTLEKQRDEIEARFQVARRERDREKLRLIQREIQRNTSDIARLEMTHPGALVRAMAVEDAARPKNSPVFIRGEAENRGEIVPRQFLQLLAGTNRPAFTNGSGRLELAQAIVSPHNPLTPRVMVNRIWQHHFGAGFVTTPDDFGTMSEPPSHRELLDYLAVRFREDGWSMKKMHRLIMLSSVYQQTTTDHARYAQVDPFNRLLWRANIQRIEFESLRDSLLAIGGSLDVTLHGRPVDFERNPTSTRRTIYGIVDRSDLLDAFVNFDFANPDMVNGRRYETSVPQQALFLMNSPIVIAQARKLVASDAFKSCRTDTERVEQLYQRIYQRLPTELEQQLARDFVTWDAVPTATAAAPVRVASADLTPQQRRQEMQLARRNEQAARQRDVAAKSKPAPLTVWEEYAHALLQANEFSFVN
jgi:hypothetical protein